MNIHTQIMPKTISDERLDAIILLFELIKQGKHLRLSLENTQIISPAGLAILCNLLDAASETNSFIEFINVDPERKAHQKIFELSKLAHQTKGYLASSYYQFEFKDMIIWHKINSIAPEILPKIENKFSNILSESQLWNVSLILNELMQNTVDHSTSERYFIYAGLHNNDFEFGIIDRGITIPAKLETKYEEKNDQEYIKKSLQYAVGTRKSRAGGMGLYYLFEILKSEKGKMVIISRNGQLRRHFSSRNIKSTPTKQTLYGTWCMARIPLEKIK